MQKYRENEINLHYLHSKKKNYLHISKKSSTFARFYGTGTRVRYVLRVINRRKNTQKTN